MSVARAESLAVKSTVDSSFWNIVKAYVTLTKPRITAFVVLTAYCAAIAAQRGLPSFRVAAALVVGLALSSGGSAAINMWYDRDIDKVMKRTANRPIPMGLVPAWAALWFGLALGVLSVVVCAVWLNTTTAVLSVAGFIYYAVIYTMWLKRSTPQNIVIGGGAGAVPPLMGWAAVTGHVSIAAWLMFGLIFLWTPPHFWSLALLKNEDYRRAGIPMMPVVRGARSTKVQSVWYAAILWLAGIALYFTASFHWIYLVSAMLIGAAFFAVTVKMLREPDSENVWVRWTFLASLLYLPVMFAAIVAGAVL
jgi:heme o synthase